MKIYLPLFFIFLSQLAFSQSTTVIPQSSGIRGRLTGKNNEPLAGAFVSLTGTSFKTITDNNGDFVLQHVPPGEYTITAEYVGYATISRHLLLKSGEIEKIDFELETKGSM